MKRSCHGQMISFIGSGLTSFALGVWVFQKTGSITQYALISLFFVLPGVLLGPLAGTLVDRWDRRQAMLISDLGAGLSTLSIAVMYMLGRLQVWDVYLAVFMSGAFGSLRMLSMMAAMTQLIPEKSFGRASGMMEIVQVGQYIIAPIVAGGLMGSIGLAGVVLVDFTSFLFAISTLLFVHIPRSMATADGKAGNGPLAGSIGQILDMGPGRGIGLLFVSMGLLLALVTAISYLSPHLRRGEDDLPDAVTAQMIRGEVGNPSLTPLPASD